MWGLGFRVWGLGFRVGGLGFRVYEGLASKMYTHSMVLGVWYRLGKFSGFGLSLRLGCFSHQKRRNDSDHLLLLGSQANEHRQNVWCSAVLDVFCYGVPLNPESLQFRSVFVGYHILYTVYP